MKRTKTAIFGMTVLFLGFASGGRGQEPDAGKTADQELKAGWGRYFDRQARDYSLTHGGTKSTLVPKPVLNWSVRGLGSTDGAAYVWADAGRPVAIGTAFAAKTGPTSWKVIHEFHSLTPEPVNARWRGREMWNSRGPGLDFKPLTDSPEPAALAPARLRQMKLLAGDFSAESTDARGVRRELRLLPTPLYRYEIPETGAVDGALFAFVNETDPEALLVLETVEEPKPARWRYAVASYTDLSLHIRRRKVDLWDDPWTDRIWGPGEVHVGLRVELVEGGPNSGPLEVP